MSPHYICRRDRISSLVATLYLTYLRENTDSLVNVLSFVYHIDLRCHLVHVSTANSVGILLTDPGR